MGSLKYFRFTLPFFRIATSASGALCLSAFYHLDLKFDVSQWACNEAYDSSSGACDASLFRHSPYLDAITCTRLAQPSNCISPPLGAAMAFRIAGTKFVLSHHAGLFRKDEHHVPPATAEASLGYT